MNHDIKVFKTQEESKAPFRLSVSKAKTFSDCKLKYKFTYLDKLPRIERDFHIFGKFLHSILENFHKIIIKDPKLKSEYIDVLNFAWDKSLEEYQEKLTKEQIVDAKKITNEYQSIIKEEGIPNVTAVERPFYIEIDGRVLLNGFIDREQEDEDMPHVCDYKTTKDPKYLKDDFFQLATYGFVLGAMNPEMQNIRASYILLKHNFRYLTKVYTRKEVMEPSLKKIMQYVDDIEAEKIYRPNPQFLCKYCDHLDRCDSGHRFLEKKGVIEKKIKIGVIKF